MNVEFHPDVHQQLQKLPRRVFAATLDMIITRSHDPRPAGVTKLVGGHSDWRVRIGEYRIVYEIDDVTGTVTIMQVQHRRDVYR